MKQRNPIAVFLLSLVTCGIYSLYWLVKTKGEMNKMGEKIPTAWIWLIPFVGSIWWLWKYSEGVEHITGEKPSGVMAFVLLFLLGNIGQAIIQDYFNKVGEKVITPATADSTTPIAPVVSMETTNEPVIETQQMAPTTPIEPTAPVVPEQPTTQPDDNTAPTTPFGPSAL